MTTQSLKRNFFQKLLGIPATQAPANSDGWSYKNNQVEIYLEKIPELSEPDGGIRLEGKNLKTRILVFKDSQGNFKALKNKCNHAGRRLDPIPGCNKVQCCSVSKATYTIDGEVISGPAKEPIKTFPVKLKDNKLFISLE